MKNKKKILLLIFLIAIFIFLVLDILNKPEDVIIVEKNFGWQGGTPNTPILTEGMIPIKYNGTDWISTTIDDKEWYDYIDTKQENDTLSDTVDGENCRKWANVMLKDGSMFVWIPRYTYKITKGFQGENLEYNGNVTKQAGEIAIKFSDNLIDNNDDEYITPLAFSFGEKELEGIWVAKFETSREDATSDTFGESNNIKITANVKPYTNITINDIFTTVRNMEKTDLYGWKAQNGKLNESGLIDNDSNNFDTHAMKRTEWGTVAYLTQSIGKTGEVWINPYTTYLTGQAGESVSAESTIDTYNYNTSNGVHASTTDNVYGIYDMNGGAWEYMMANKNDTIEKSELTAFPISKYYDKYSEYEDKIIYGDAIYEVSLLPIENTSWYEDYSAYLHVGGYWFLIGGSQNRKEKAGLFAFNHYEGQADSDSGFRVIVVNE